MNSTVMSVWNQLLDQVYWWPLTRTWRVTWNKVSDTAAKTGGKTPGSLDPVRSVVGTARVSVKEGIGNHLRKQEHVHERLSLHLTLGVTSRMWSLTRHPNTVIWSEVRLLTDSLLCHRTWAHLRGNLHDRVREQMCFYTLGLGNGFVDRMDFEDERGGEDELSG
jgi:hypothetical protein